ncbi:hypothetical protein Lal_00036838 [Lupinus albus]|uniref:Uncharacterized protein n=1 Tax=Lupinus albus TaxID=3870 RepID=A0A6A4PU09_LUPAL|nr:hypothetical protein Lalb_Chr10g0092471 [Lupinus albus]KAF1888796.1 hypothetical protein Lal_00036838 [Lupinus albus]
MNHASNSTITTSKGATLRNMVSPIPYLFGGLAFMLGLISIALLIIACSYRKQNSSSTLASDEEKSSNKVVNKEMDSEQKIVVIMAGESNPTYLAKPISSTSYSEQVFSK